MLLLKAGKLAHHIIKNLGGASRVHSFSFERDIITFVKEVCRYLNESGFNYCSYSMVVVNGRSVYICYSISTMGIY